jgi:hypothetical protein
MNNIIIVIFITIFYAISVFLARLDAIDTTRKMCTFSKSKKLDNIDFFFIFFLIVNLSLSLYFIFILLRKISILSVQKFVKLIPIKFRNWFITIK